jgi:sulfatase maturation enzyme AslB (radical SAM superfamily)
MNKDTFCVMPWRGVTIDNYGQLRACCSYDTTTVTQSFQHQSTMDNYKFWKIKMLEPMRQQMLNGERPQGCHKCFEVEDAKTDSLSDRQIMNAAFDHNQDFSQFDTSVTDQIQFLFISYGNICNLRCNMCGPSSSSAWNTEAKQHTLELLNFRKPIDNIHFKWAESAELEKMIPNLLQHLRAVTLLGGEPLFSPDGLRFLEQLPNNLELSIVTNGTTLSESTCNILSKFDDLRVMVSIDGVGLHNNYVRYGSKWHEIQKNIARLADLPNLRSLVIYYILQHYSYYTLIPMLQYCLDNQFTMRIQPVTWHQYLTVNTLSPDQRDEFLNRIDQFLIQNKCNDDSINDAIAYVKSVLTTQYSFDEDSRSKFIEFTQSIDSIRKISFAQAFGKELYIDNNVSKSL